MNLLFRNLLKFNLIATKRKERYCDVVRHLRTRIRLAMLRTTLIAFRGPRSIFQNYRMLRCDNFTHFFRKMSKKTGSLLVKLCF